MPAGRGGPDQDAAAGLFQLPPVTLFAFMMMPAQRSDITLTCDPAPVPRLSVIEVTASRGLGAARRGASGVPGVDQVLQLAAGPVAAFGPGIE